MEGPVEIPEESWIRGGTPETSRIVPWDVRSLDSDDIGLWQGRLGGEIVDEAVAALLNELQP